MLLLTEPPCSSRFNIVQRRQSSPVDAASKPKFMEIARRLEEGLYKMANSKVSQQYFCRVKLAFRIIWFLLVNSNKFG